ncbi:MAG: ABC-2 family transporter protein [Bacilli bacterium]|nr:ABC-2 family transporter protein [Bacilli bacterium]
MKAYLNYFKLRIITNLQYRSAALAGISTQLFFGFLYIMLYLAIYESNTSVNAPMDWSSLVTYLWLQQAFFAVTYPFMKDQELLNMIKNGNLAYELVRPQSFFWKFYIKMLSERLVSALLRCVPIITISLLLPYPYKLSLPPTLGTFILFILALSFACLLVTSLSLIVHIITMFTLDARGITSAYSMIAEVFMGIVIPLPFFPKWMMKISNILPFRFIGDFPYRTFSGSIGFAEGREMLIISGIWIIITLIIGYLISKVALKKAVIQGG